MKKRKVKLTSELAYLDNSNTKDNNEQKLAVLRIAIDRGIASGIARPDVFGRVRRKNGLPIRSPISREARARRTRSA